MRSIGMATRLISMPNTAATTPKRLATGSGSGMAGGRPTPTPSELRSTRGPIDVTIIIPTLRRQHLLEDLIKRCFAQRNLDDVRLEVLVVDNCPQRSAEALVTRLCGDFGSSLVYAAEPRPGVSHVRNTGLRRARG